MIPVLLQLRTVSAFAVIALATWAVGSVALSYCCAPTGGERRVRFVWEMAIGLLAWGTLLTVAGMVGLLFADGIVAATLAATLLGLVRIRHELRLQQPFATTATTTGESMPLWLRVALLSGAAMALGASFLAALAPPLAGDALCYHLELPKRFLADHGLTYYRDNDNSTFPLLTEMWFLWGLALDGAIGAQLMHWLCGVVLGGAAYVLALPLVGRSWSVGAACVVLLAPGINNQMTAPLNDVALALFTTLGLAAWLQTSKKNEGAASGTGAWTLLGLMVGGALAVKYTALVFTVVLAASVVAKISRVRVAVRPQWIRGACAAAMIAAVVAGPWYLRAAYYRGDPLFPFLSAHAADGAPSKFPETKTPLGRGIGAVVEAPWSMTMEPDRFGGRGHQLGPLFLMLVPCIAVAARRRELQPVLITAALYGACCVLLRQNVRFLFPLVPLLAVIVVAVLGEIAGWERIPRWIASSATAATLLFLTVIPMARVRSSAPVAIGLESRDEFLARREPTFASAEWLNANLPAGAHVLSQEQRAFYYEPRWTRENVYRRNSSYNQPRFGALEPFEERLKAAGFTHLFLAEKESVAGLPAGPSIGAAAGVVKGATSYDATLSTLADTAMAARPASGPTLVQEWRSEVDGDVRRYRLLQLR